MMIPKKEETPHFPLPSPSPPLQQEQRPALSYLTLTICWIREWINSRQPQRPFYLPILLPYLAKPPRRNPISVSWLLSYIFPNKSKSLAKRRFTFRLCFWHYYYFVCYGTGQSEVIPNWTRQNVSLVIRGGPPPLVLGSCVQPRKPHDHFSFFFLFFEGLGRVISRQRERLHVVE